jgi:hypothetical protein
VGARGDEVPRSAFVDIDMTKFVDFSCSGRRVNGDRTARLVLA